MAHRSDRVVRAPRRRLSAGPLLAAGARAVLLGAILLVGLALGGCASAPSASSSSPLPKYDVAKATRYLRSHAKKRPAPPWECVAYTRRALEAGGIALERAGHARDYGRSLERAGFRKLAASERPMAGDVVVFGAIGPHREGHLGMFDGTQWISDFLQPRFLPSRDYAGAPFAIYRYRGRKSARGADLPTKSTVPRRNEKHLADSRPSLPWQPRWSSGCRSPSLPSNIPASRSRIRSPAASRATPAFPPPPRVMPAIFPARAVSAVS